MKKSSLFIANILIVLMCLSCNGQKPAVTDGKTATRYIHQPNLQPLIMKVINKKTSFGYDSAYTAFISKPSPWLSDFFGLQAIKTLSKQQIEKDFVPKYASVVSSDSNQLELRFKAGWQATFYVNTSLSVGGNVLPVDHVFFNDSTWQLFTSHIEDFKSILKNEKLEEKYLIPNPYYDNEKIVYARMMSGAEHANVIIDSTYTAFAKTENAIFIFQDPSHGNPATYYELYDMLKKLDYDWFALEMMNASQQKNIDTYLTGTEGTPAFEKAKNQLMEDFSEKWVSSFVIREKFDKPENSHYFRLLTMLRERKKRVYALENDDLNYVAFRFGESNFGGVVRNHLWASRMPSKGKGIVFGGGMHFNFNKPVNFQDFARAKNKSWIIFSRYPIKYRN